ncbi:MAG: indole-3-glycerol phosphate synthase TrpC [Dysgonamonadaceae bacterium]|jgi:indole-3-glycerol phosphate synthase|nr:indole-3-glycerol phosphate synthase TrpC [Dysgonamonadaceae bacterium]
MISILEKIISAKRQEIACHKELTSLESLKKMSKKKTEIRSFRQSLLDSPTGIISEFKRKSPSKGWIFQEARIEKIVPDYVAFGATALSVLTDEPFFGGSLNDLETARGLVNIPVLRKDFIVDAYQIYQAHLFGADVILLIASALTVKETALLASTAKELELEVLLEIHTEDELNHINEYVDVVGINNRNLSSFETNIQTSFDLGEKIPDTFVKISESGISDPLTVRELRSAGFRGFLMGENFMKTDNPGEALKNFISQI